LDVLQWRPHLVALATTLVLTALSATGGRFELFSYLDW
jgi:hypothetical protein